MTIVPPFDEDEKNLREVVDRNEEKGDWDTTIPYPVLGVDRSLSKGLKHTQRLAIRGATIVSDLLKRDKGGSE